MTRLINIIFPQQQYELATSLSLKEVKDYLNAPKLAAKKHVIITENVLPLHIVVRGKRVSIGRNTNWSPKPFAAGFHGQIIGNGDTCTLKGSFRKPLPVMAFYLFALGAIAFCELGLLLDLWLSLSGRHSRPTLPWFASILFLVAQPTVALFGLSMIERANQKDLTDIERIREFLDALPSRAMVHAN